MTDPPAATDFDRFLAPGETVLWQGRSHPGLAAARNLLMALTGIAAGLFVAFGALGGARAGVAPGFILLQLSMLIICAGVALMPVTAWVMAKSRRFAITQGRILIRKGGLIAPRVQAIALNTIRTADLRRLRSGPADLVLITGPSRMLSFWRRVVVLDGIENGEAALALVQEHMPD